MKIIYVYVLFIIRQWCDWYRSDTDTDVYIMFTVRSDNEDIAVDKQRIYLCSVNTNEWQWNYRPCRSER